MLHLIYSHVLGQGERKVIHTSVVHESGSRMLRAIWGSSFGDVLGFALCLRTDKDGSEKKHEEAPNSCSTVLEKPSESSLRLEPRDSAFAGLSTLFSKSLMRPMGKGIWSRPGGDTAAGPGSREWTGCPENVRGGANCFVSKRMGLMGLMGPFWGYVGIMYVARNASSCAWNAGKVECCMSVNLGSLLSITWCTNLHACPRAQ